MIDLQIIVNIGDCKDIIDLQLDSEITQEPINVDNRVVNTIKGNVHILFSKFKLNELRISFRCDSLIIITPMETNINLNGKYNHQSVFINFGSKDIRNLKHDISYDHQAFKLLFLLRVWRSIDTYSCTNKSERKTIYFLT